MAVQLEVTAVDFQPAEGVRYGERRDLYNDPWAKTRVFFWQERESILDGLALRHDRPFDEYRKLLPEVFKALGIEPVKARWSQRAGCSCPCSPGFILDVALGGIVSVTYGGRDDEAEKVAKTFRSTGVIVKRDGSLNDSQLLGALDGLLAARS